MACKTAHQQLPDSPILASRYIDYERTLTSWIGLCCIVCPWPECSLQFLLSHRQSMGTGTSNKALLPLPIRLICVNLLMLFFMCIYWEYCAALAQGSAGLALVTPTNWTCCGSLCAFSRRSKDVVIICSTATLILGAISSKLLFVTRAEHCLTLPRRASASASPAGCTASKCLKISA